MMELPLLYIIIPVYHSLNTEHFTRCLDSIKNQTHKNYRIYLVSDGDGLNYDELKNEYPIHEILYLKENKGPGVARQCSLDSIETFEKGSYVTFMDSDDFLPDMNTFYVLSRVLMHHRDVPMVSFMEMYYRKNEYQYQEREDGSLHGVYFRSDLIQKYRDIIRFPEKGMFEDYFFREHFHLFTHNLGYGDERKIDMMTYVAVKRDDSITNKIVSEGIENKGRELSYIELTFSKGIWMFYDLIAKMLVGNRFTDDHRFRKDVAALLKKWITSFNNFQNINSELYDQNHRALKGVIEKLMQYVYKDSLYMATKYLEEVGDSDKEADTFMKIAMGDYPKPYDYLLSIIIPLYHSKGLIEDTLSDLNDKIDSACEIILIADDDEDYAYLLKMAKNIRFFRNEYHRGFATSRNEALKYVRGKWVLFLDHDDRITKNVLKTLYTLNNDEESAVHFLVNYNGVDNRTHSYAGHHGLIVSYEFLLKNKFHFPYQLTSSEDLYYNRFVYGKTHVRKIFEIGYKWVKHERNTSGLTFGKVGFFEWNFAAHIYASLLTPGKNTFFDELFLECIYSMAFSKKFENRELDEEAYIAMDCLLMTYFGGLLNYADLKGLTKFFKNEVSRNVNTCLNAEAQARAFIGDDGDAYVGDIVNPSNIITEPVKEVLKKCYDHFINATIEKDYSISYVYNDESLRNALNEKDVLIVMDDKNYEKINPELVKDIFGKTFFITTNAQNPKLERLKYLIKRRDENDDIT